MKRETYVSIPQPCHENWDAMTPQDKGRFCAGCAKTVVDFSVMSDTQILDFLSQSKGRICGRFAEDQIERPLIPIKKEKKKIWWMVALMPLTLLLNRASGQKKIVKEKPAVVKETEVTMGMVALPIRSIEDDTSKALQKTVCGYIKDESGNTIPFSTVTLLDNRIQTTTDANGYFYLKAAQLQQNAKLLVSNISYEQKEVIIDLNDTMNIVLKEKQAVLPEVCVRSTESFLSGRLGGLVSVVTVVRKDTIKTTFRKALHINPLKVYPNPATRGTEVHMEVKKQGHYSIQLLDLNSKLITQKLFDAEKGAATTFIIPSTIAAGMYFIRLINDDTKQQLTDKIIVQ